MKYGGAAVGARFLRRVVEYDVIFCADVWGKFKLFCFCVCICSEKKNEVCLAWHEVEFACDVDRELCCVDFECGDSVLW
jgi:hypothetical protein